MAERPTLTMSAGDAHRTLTIKKGDVLFRQGDASDRVLRVWTGEVEVLREVGVNSVALGHVRGGEWLGEMGVIENRRRSATARQDILDELDFEPSVKATNIGVGVENCVVTLTGHVFSYAERFAAEQAVRRVKGVRGIAQEIEVRFPSDKDCDQPVLTTALQIARTFSGHMECLRVVSDPTALVMQAAQMDLVGSMMLADALNVVEQQNREATQRARAALTEFCKREDIASTDKPLAPTGVSAHWRGKTGDEFDELTAHARFHDLVLLAGGSERKGRLPPEGIGQIIIGCGRPVLLAAQRPQESVTRTFAIAWKNTPEAARAVTAAMPLLSKAERIEVLSANEEDKRAIECLDCSGSIVQQIRWHGLNAYGHFVIPADRTIPNAILETAHGFNADLLVMGGYGHSRLREFIFGGFTRHVLDGVDLPVLVFH